LKTKSVFGHDFSVFGHKFIDGILIQRRLFVDLHTLKKQK
jgi:hypothetical protein